MTTNKQLIEKADKLAAACKKLTDGLAKDGVALEGFTEALNAQKEWVEIKFKRTFEQILNRTKL